MLLCPLTIRIVWEERNDKLIHIMLHIFKEYREEGGTKSTFHNTFTMISIRFSFEYQENCFDLQCLSNSIQKTNRTRTWASPLLSNRTSSAINSRGYSSFINVHCFYHSFEWCPIFFIDKLYLIITIFSIHWSHNHDNGAWLRFS